MEWLALCIPVVFGAVKLLYFSKKVLWWELGIPLGVSIVLILVTKLCVTAHQVSDVEYFGGYATEARYYEGWNERVPCTHTKYCKDSDGDSYPCGNEHMYDVDEHAPYWELHDNNGSVLRMDTGSTFGFFGSWAKETFPRFEKLATHWGPNNRSFHELDRSHHTVDGDMYSTRWPAGDFERLRPVTTSFKYQNKVQVASSVFNFRKLDEKDVKEYELFDYPEIDSDYHQVQILGNGGPSQFAAERQLQLANALLGRPKQVRIFILIFRNKPLEASFFQEALWKGGNKNEFIMTIGVDDNFVPQWARAFSWSESERLKVDAREYVGQTFIDKKEPVDLVYVANWLTEEVEKQFVRKNFHDFDYLSVPPPLWGYWLIFGLTILVNGGVSFWILANQFEEPGERSWSFPRRLNFRYR